MKAVLLNTGKMDPEFREQIAALYRQLNPHIAQKRPEEIMDKNGTTVFACIRDGDHLVGIALMAMYKVISGHKGIIEDVVVDREYRRQGYGRMLMFRLLEEAKRNHLDEILLFTAHHRVAAIGLYQSLGFTMKESGLYVLKINRHLLTS